ncbi:hypothetical protein QBC47DRAFT_465575 [Echria macrotheca]|uniref:Uncharacterized protein n=1 Tax=Echria macrotheca TaxID=438768 RepID=A0AAJ0EZV4_9PEZI|nr:hypothetical protein QBC47DRAFT_465575 [Echria macrotheca]
MPEMSMRNPRPSASRLAYKDREKSDDGVKNDNREKKGANGVPSVLNLTIFLPGRTHAQSIELSFDPAWAPSLEPIAINFDASQGMAIAQSQTGKFGSRQVKLRDTVVATTALTARLAGTQTKQTRPAWPWWKKLAVAFLAIIPAVILLRRFSSTTSKVPGSHVQAAELDFHTPISVAAENYVTAVQSLTGEIVAKSPNGTLLSPKAATDAIWSLKNSMGDLCHYAGYIPHRPDLGQLCHDFLGACSAAEDAVTYPNITAKHASDMAALLRETTDAFDELDDWRKDRGDESSSLYDVIDDEEANKEIARQRQRHTFQTADLLQRYVPRELKSCARMLTQFRYFDFQLREMAAKAPYVTEAFEYEMTKTAFGSSDNLEDIGALLKRLTDAGLPFAAEILRRVETGIGSLEEAVSHLQPLNMTIHRITHPDGPAPKTGTELVLGYLSLLFPVLSAPIADPDPYFEEAYAARLEMQKVSERIQAQLPVDN